MISRNKHPREEKSENAATQGGQTGADGGSGRRYAITHKFRRLQTTPCHLYRALKHRELGQLFHYAAHEMRAVRRAGSAFLGLHLLRLLSNDRAVPDVNVTFIRRCFTAACGETVKDDELTATKAIWAERAKMKMPARHGLGPQVTYAAKQYLTAFQNYHLFGLQQHWAKLCRVRHDVSRSVSEMAIRRIFEKRKLDPVQGPRLSSKKYKNAISIPVPKDDELNTRLSTCSLKTSSYDTYLANVPGWTRETRCVFAVYGTRTCRAKKAKRANKLAQFYATVAGKLFPEQDAIVIMGDAKIQVSMKGRSTCPTAKVTRAIAQRRRLIFANERFTTAKWSSCRDREKELAIVKDMRKGPNLSRSGKVYIPDLHGLRQCPHCHRSWNRDLNAARNIFFCGLAVNRTGAPPPYLARRPDGVPAPPKYPR